MDIDSIWDELENKLLDLAPAAITSLRRPATAIEIAKLEKTVGLSLPVDFKHYLLVHDGQISNSTFMLCEQGALLSISQILRVWTTLNEINEYTISNLNDWWNRKYLPFTMIEGDHACINLENGEILFHTQDSNFKTKLADNFITWFQDRLQVLKNEQFVIDEGFFDFWNITVN